MRTLMDRVLAPGGLSVVFQPMIEFSASGLRLYGFESLSRGPECTNAERAEVLFEYVRRMRREPEVDRLCVALAFARAADLLAAHPRVRLSVNVHASTFAKDPGFSQFVLTEAGRKGIETSRITVELVETSEYWDIRRLARELEPLAARGVKIALDDFGTGQANFKMILATRPDLLKIDRFLVDRVSSDPSRRAIVRSLAELASKLGSRAVAEGVSNAADGKILVDLGIDLFQGFWFSPPRTAEDLAGFRVQDLQCFESSPREVTHV